jgi:hypothetical protein
MAYLLGNPTLLLGDFSSTVCVLLLEPGALLPAAFQIPPVPRRLQPVSPTGPVFLEGPAQEGQVSHFPRSGRLGR